MQLVKKSKSVWHGRASEIMIEQIFMFHFLRAANRYFRLPFHRL